MESRPILTRVPDNSVIVTDRVPTTVPRPGRFRFVAARDEAGTFAIIYAPIQRPFTVRMDVIQGSKVKVWWFDPRNGQATLVGEFSNTGTRRFDPPALGEATDWVLVLDDASKNYPLLGKVPPLTSR
jgi:hypothetical protein